MKTVFTLLAVFAALVFLSIGATYLGAASNVATAPARAVNSVVATQNIINSYDGFYALKVAYDSKVSDIQNYKALALSETDPGQVRLVKQNLFAMSATCREVANRYNANSEKLTSSWFRDQRLDYTLDASACTVSF